MSRDEVLAAALALPNEDRAHLLDRLAISLDDESIDDWRRRVLRRRVALAERGEPSDWVSHEQVVTWLATWGSDSETEPGF